MKHLPVLAAAVLATTALFVACDDETTSIGSSLVNDKSEVIIDSSFVVTGSSYRDAAVQSRTLTQLLGSLNAKEFGNISSDFVTQFMPAARLDTAGVKVDDIDSVKMLMFFTKGDFTGDSLVPMGLKVYPLKKQLEIPIFSNFDPADYYDESNCWTTQSQIYTGNALYNDSVNNLAYRTISVKLPLEFGRKVYNQYINHPETFATPQAFAKFFPGLYVKNTFGQGRVTNITNTRINFYFTQHDTYTKDGEERDTTYNVARSYMAVTPEVITNNIISLSLSQDLTNRVAQGQTLLVSPTGYNARLTFPAQEILRSYRNNATDLSVINGLYMAIPVEEITNGYNIAPPANVLLLLSKDRETFFDQNKIADDKTSFLATYDATNHQYVFSGMRNYIVDLFNKETVTADDYTFDLVPVDVTYENSGNNYYYGSTTTYVSSIQPYVSGPAMCRLLLNDVKIKFTYSKQSINNL
jgi:putative lipoprotein